MWHRSSQAGSLLLKTLAIKREGVFISPISLAHLCSSASVPANLHSLYLGVGLLPLCETQPSWHTVRLLTFHCSSFLVMLGTESITSVSPFQTNEVGLANHIMRIASTAADMAASFVTGDTTKPDSALLTMRDSVEEAMVSTCMSMRSQRGSPMKSLSVMAANA